jgi:sRNA-binding protein
MPADLGLALKLYTSNKIYRSRLIAGAARIGLDGEPAGVVAPEQVPQPRKTAPPPCSAPKRLSLADLRIPARARKAAAR